jgi:Core-2/I-Branching enzyme
LKPRIVFAVMSAMQKPSTVLQLVDALAPHTVLIHHDFRKQKDFQINRPNVRWVADPKETGWGNWGFSDGIYHTLDYALRELEFDYFQLLSPTCLPIRPLADFEQHISSSDCEIHGDFFDISADQEMMMIFGFRAYVPAKTLRIALLQRAQRWYFGPEVKVQQHVSLSIRKRDEMRPMGPIPAFKAQLGLGITELAKKGLLHPHPFNDSFRPYIGSTWVGLSHKACAALAKTRQDPRVDGHFRRLPIVDEIMFPTFLANSGFKIGPGNHVINTFTTAGSPEWISDEDFKRMIQTPLFFARKFPDDAESPIRLAALDRLRSPLHA